jgi:hypothetical protein
MKNRILTYALIGIALSVIGIATAATTYALAPTPDKPLERVLLRAEPQGTSASLEAPSAELVEWKRIVGSFRQELAAQKREK